MSTAAIGSGGPSRPQLARLYYLNCRRTITRYGVAPNRLLRALDERVIFVVGSPRSGTSFMARTIGSVAGFADLGELAPLKRRIPMLYSRSQEEQAKLIRATMTIAQRLGLLAGLRPVEQTPESTFLIPAIASAYPEARFVHMVRDGRDVAASLVGLGWVRDTASDRLLDEVGNPLGDQARFWVEADRTAEFAKASEATRAAWVWSRYEKVAREHLSPLRDRTIEVRYEDLVRDPESTAAALAQFFDADDRLSGFVRGFAHANRAAQGRWQKDPDSEQLSDVLAEAGPVLVSLGYTV